MPISSIQLHMEIQSMKVDFHTERAVFELRTNPRQFDITTEPAKVEISSRPYGVLEIDQSPCRASYGIYEHPEFVRQMAELGRQTALETIGRIAQEGDRMAAIETGEPVFANLAAEATIQEVPDITIVPISKPDIRYTPNPPKFNPIPGKVNLSFEPGSVQIDYQPGRVSGTVIQYPNIRFFTTGSNVDIAT